MFKNRKVGNSLEIGELRKPKLRMFRPGQAFQASLIRMDETDRENVCGDSLKDIGTAMLEAERRKAKALYALQNNRRFY